MLHGKNNPKGDTEYTMEFFHATYFLYMLDVVLAQAK